ncbi:PTS ascorbate transporter subunit IIC [Vallitalea okinawensis]|uniref:PTS ascorbate transporter subunit IIC n=1 Tax=Vallitalea okinawensis TaxID=2078660 RepID=UPI000CFB4551|nr:PTS ascorbate transporter subunit IIC [Vallitalea okinawensis]
MSFISYLTSNIFKQPSIFLGVIAMIGLILQRKSIGEIIKGTFKTIIGVIILFIGVNLIGTAASPLSTAFATLYNLPEANQFNPTAWLDILGTHGSTIGLVIVLAFIINIIAARFTPMKNIFLTGHIFFWMSYIFVSAGVEAGLDGTVLVVFATAFLALYIIVVPALLKPFVKQVTGSDDFTIGHTAAIYCFIGSLIGKFFGDKEKSTEDIKIPSSLDFLRDTTIITSLVMFLTYIVVGLIIGQEARVEVFGSALGSINTIPGMQYDLFTFSLMAGLTFGAGLTILLTGVRLMLGEIIPAFKGISDKLIPNAIPALDIPMIFPYAPNALLIGFIVSMITSIGTILVLASTGTLTYAVIPLTVACFFDVAPGAIFANATGGRRAAIITSIVSGILMIFLVSVSIGVVFNTAAGFNQLFGGNDFSLWSVISYWIGNLFS